MTFYFGERWDAPIVDDAEQRETPVGIECLECREAIADGDRGFLRPLFAGLDAVIAAEIVVRVLALTPVGNAVLTAVHLECDMLGVVGHMVGVCSCTDYAGLGYRTRAAALETERRWLARPPVVGRGQ